MFAFPAQWWNNIPVHLLFKSTDNDFFTAGKPHFFLAGSGRVNGISARMVVRCYALWAWLLYLGQGYAARGWVRVLRGYSYMWVRGVLSMRQHRPHNATTLARLHSQLLRTQSLWTRASTARRSSACPAASPARTAAQGGLGITCMFECCVGCVFLNCICGPLYDGTAAGARRSTLLLFR